VRSYDRAAAVGPAATYAARRHSAGRRSAAPRNQVRRPSHARPARPRPGKLLTRTGLDWTHKYPAIAEALASIDARQAYFDGELCGVGPDGITSFGIVQLASDSGNAAALVFFLFDLHLDGED
jgi:hypothetical protein